jgi:hypothetical protein
MARVYILPRKQGVALAVWKLKAAPAQPQHG